MDVRDTHAESLPKLSYYNHKYYYYSMYGYFSSNTILPVKQIAHFSLAEEPQSLS